MRRMKVIGKGCYYHLMNRVGGPKGSYPFGDVDKEYGFRLLQNLTEYFLIEVISAAWMGNHFHLVVYAPSPDELPALDQIAARHNAYYKSMHKTFTYGPKLPQISSKNEKLCCEIGIKMIDISYFMRALQQRYTVVYNQNHDSIGRLWADRFKSVILEQKEALEACVQYVELNPVRAGLVNDPADYRFTTWGRYCGSGKHMFGDNFIKHMKYIMPAETPNPGDDQIYAEFGSSLTIIIATEQGSDALEMRETGAQSRRKESMPIRFMRRTRHFTDGAILGTKIFIRETGGQFNDPSRVNKKQLSRGHNLAGAAIYCFRKLRC